MNLGKDDSFRVPVVLLLLAVAAGAVLLSYLAFSEALSADLLAVWAAGRNFAEGNLDQIYPVSTGIFTMLPPDGWSAQFLADGYEESIYPFIYPPLWAVVGSVLYRLADFSTIVQVASFLNPLMLVATLWIALRNSVPAAWMPVCFLLGLGLLATGLSARIALEQNQPQILVAFLTVLAIDRQRNCAPLGAGAALALAASLKIYPALYALFWLARGQNRAAAAFALAGGALGLTSLLLGGIQLHLEFLQQLSDISGTALVTYFTWSVDPTVAQLFMADRLDSVLELRNVAADEVATGWWILKKSALWRGLDLALLLAVLAVLVFVARRTRSILFWPVAFTALSLVSPLSWGYHYLAPLVFAPALLVHLGMRRGLVALTLVFVPQMTFLLDFDVVMQFWKYVALPAGTASMLCYMAFLVVAMRREDRESLVSLPLRPGTRQL
ncbi:glycosyltransferase 87 family protein [Frigidibacter sp. ROC022]|uniref:glycosyltransferase 87 family protein n=1 Tax=Frigidibacter sp. ROC022 TaxID=2971796 RepID=UPI00215A8534|nr:glycosyltransferase 87 family protein [Frigidibacter sp. ROC022]MCR8726250.1 glycosyltransferase 87 family protein [Frigidibacter sp. ROC022]